MASLKSCKMKLFNKLKLALPVVVLLFVGLSNLSFGQTNSVNVNIQFTTVGDPADSLSFSEAMDLNVQVPDVDFVNHVMVTVYEPTSNFPIAKVKFTKSELEGLNQVSGNSMQVIIPGLEPSASYRVETLVRNFQGANYPINETLYNAQ